jgi:hypothetical protein
MRDNQRVSSIKASVKGCGKLPNVVQDGGVERCPCSIHTANGPQRLVFIYNRIMGGQTLLMPIMFN